MSEIEWVGSKEEAERYVLLDESPVVLFDETCDRFYVKMVDGMKSYVFEEEPDEQHLRHGQRIERLERDVAELRGMYENLARQEGDHLSALAAQAERLLWADGTITTECRDFLIELLAQHKQKAKALKEQLR